MCAQHERVNAFLFDRVKELLDHVSLFDHELVIREIAFNWL